MSCEPARHVGASWHNVKESQAMKRSILSLVALLIGLGAISAPAAMAAHRSPSYSENAGGGSG
jgi:hypothetical protein